MNKKCCTKCNVVKSLNNFYKVKHIKSGLNSHCKECDAKRTKIYRDSDLDRYHKRGKIYREKNKDKIKQKYIRNKDNICENVRNRTAKVKKLVIKILGGKCVCCGVSEWWNLTVDHIKPLMRKDRTIQTNYNVLMRMNNFTELQCMCYGCNASKNATNGCKIQHAE